MKIGHVASERTSSWPILDQKVGWEKRKEQKRKRKKKREFLRERLHPLFKFPDDRTSGLRRSKMKSSSSQQGLRIETGVEEF